MSVGNPDILSTVDKVSRLHYFAACMPGKAYQTLRHYRESPQLPAGYAGMMLLAMIPPLWMRVVHPILANHRNEMRIVAK